MRVWGMVILGAGAALAVFLGWHQIWTVLRAARTLDLFGWLCGVAGLALLVGRRRRDGGRRLVLGLILAALGLALMGVPTDSRGFLVGVRVGYAGSLLAVLPHSWRVHRTERQTPAGTKA